MRAERFVELFGYGLMILAIPLVLILGFIFLWRVSEYINYYPLGINVAVFVYGLVFSILIIVYGIGKGIEKITEVNP